MISLKPNEFIIRVNETSSGITYEVVPSIHEIDQNALSHLVGAMLAWEKIKLRKVLNVKPDNIYDDDGDIEHDD